MALLSAYVGSAEEVGVVVVTAVEVSEVSGYAGLRRRYRKAEVRTPQVETILLGYARAARGGEWGVGVIQAEGEGGR